MATALEIARRASTRLKIDQPSMLFTSSDRTEIELRQALIEASDKIRDAHDWQALLTIETHTGDGSTTEFAIPSDWLRMPKDAKLWSTRWEYPLWHISPEEWLNLDVRDYDLANNAWTIYGGNYVYHDPLITGEAGKFFYVSRNHVLSSGAVAKAEFSADDDTYKLDDRVLELMLIAEWRQQKGVDYAEAMTTAEIAMGKAIERDKGARIIRQAPRSNLRGVDVAYPLSVSS